MHLCVQKTPRGHFWSNKRPDTMLSERKRKFRFRCSCMNRVISVKRRISLSFLSSLSFSVCHSRWQSLIVLDKLMKSNTEETTGSLHLPKCMSVCAYLPLPLSGCLVSSGVPASQHDDETVREWWEARPYLRGEVRSADVKWLWNTVPTLEEGEKITLKITYCIFRPHYRKP